MDNLCIQCAETPKPVGPGVSEAPGMLEPSMQKQEPVPGVVPLRLTQIEVDPYELHWQALG